MDNRDLRQLVKMQQQIDSYQCGDIDLKSLIGDLIFLRDAISEIEKEWEHEFNDKVLDLESAYAYALEKNAGQLESISQRVVDKALPKLISLVKTKC